MAVKNNSNEHRLFQKGYDPNSSIDWVSCVCGWKKTFEYNRDNADRLIKQHILNELGVDWDQQSSQNIPFDKLHSYQGEFYEGVHKITYCICGWNKIVKEGQAAINMWTGHRGSALKEYNRKFKSGNKNKGKTQSFFGAKRNYSSFYKSADWQDIKPIAVEIFGGTFYGLPINSK